MCLGLKNKKDDIERLMIENNIDILCMQETEIEVDYATNITIEIKKRVSSLKHVMKSTTKKKMSSKGRGSFEFWSSLYHLF